MQVALRNKQAVYIKIQTNSVQNKIGHEAIFFHPNRVNFLPYLIEIKLPLCLILPS